MFSLKLPPPRGLYSQTPASRTSRRWPLALKRSSSNFVGFIDGFEGREHFAYMRVKVLTHDVENFKHERIAHGVKT
jgi:hypothetical protein